VKVRSKVSASRTPSIETAPREKAAGRDSAMPLPPVQSPSEARDDDRLRRTAKRQPLPFGYIAQSETGRAGSQSGSTPALLHRPVRSGKQNKFRATLGLATRPLRAPGHPPGTVRARRRTVWPSRRARAEKIAPETPLKRRWPPARVERETNIRTAKFAVSRHTRA
jgi:hypothetical protein